MKRMLMVEKKGAIEFKQIKKISKIPLVHMGERNAVKISHWPVLDKTEFQSIP